MTAKQVLVTGSCGLIGSEVCEFFSSKGLRVTGIESNHRAVFFGPEGNTQWMPTSLQERIPSYQHSARHLRPRSGTRAA